MSAARHLRGLNWLLVAAIFFSVLGLALDWKGFLVNTFSGVLGAAIGVWVSISIVENYLENQSATQWQQVNQNVLGVIRSQLTEMCKDYIELFDATGPFVSLLQDKESIDQHKLETVEELRRAFHNADNSVLDKGKLAGLYSRIGPHFEAIGSAKTLYVHLPGADRSLVNLLQQIETRYMNWSELDVQDKQISLSRDVLFRAAYDALLSIEATMDYFARNLQ